MDKNVITTSKLIATALDNMVNMVSSLDSLFLQFQAKITELETKIEAFGTSSPKPVVNPGVKMRRTGWVNVYPNCIAGGNVYLTESIADANANGDRIDCVLVEWEE